MEWLLIGTALFVAFSNGANDNFKGFATIWGSETLSYKQALTLATIATIAGSLSSMMLAQALIQKFSGAGLVPDQVASTLLFMVSVGSGAAVTVFIATKIGLPVSTTHALLGGLIGAGISQSGGEIHYAKLTSTFLLPLLISPLIAAGLGIMLHRLFRLRQSENDCACLIPSDSSLPPGDEAVLQQISIPSIVIAPQRICDVQDTHIRIPILQNLDRLHILSGMAICFARGVNDTPKLAALLLAAHLLNSHVSIAVISIAMAIGGLSFAKQVARTMSRRITKMDHTQGVTANLITATLVLFASKLGMPVSTTHVAVGSIAGVGASAKTLDWGVFRNILLSWIATLPLAAIVAWSVNKII